MNISEVIKKLQQIKRKYGDIEVIYTEDTYNDFFTLGGEFDFQVKTIGNETVVSINGGL